MSEHKSPLQWFLRLKQPVFALKSIGNRKTLLLLLVLSFVAGWGGAWQVKRRADQHLAEERARREKQDLIPFEQGLLKPISSKAIEIWQNHKTTDRKSTRLNSSHGYISYAVFCLKKK